MNRHISYLTILIGLIAVLAAPVQQAAAAVTPQEVEFTNQQGIVLEGHLFRPSGDGPFPAVVMMHGCSGAYSNSNQSAGVLMSLFTEWGNRLVDEGYVALLVDSFTPRGAPQDQCGSSTTSPVAARPYDAYAAYDYLDSQTYITDSIGLLGWSAGGSSAMATMVYTASTQADFGAAVIFYAGCGLNNAFSGLSKSTWKPYAPVHFFHGTADATTSYTYCQTRVNRAVTLGASAANGNPTTITLYTGAHHSFDLATQVGGNFTQADVDAKIDADQKTLDFFDDYLK